MKKLLFAIISLSLVAVGCDKTGPEEAMPTVSFEYEKALVENGKATLILSVENYNSSTPVTVPLELSGTATKDEDYMISSEAFVVGGGAPVLAITVTPLQYSGETIIASVSAPSGFMEGGIMSVSMTLDAESLGYMGRVSFEQPKFNVISTVEMPVYIVGTMDGEAEYVQFDTMISVNVDEESTAELGTHFKFVNDQQYAKIESGESYGSVAIEVLKYEEGKNTVILNIDDPRFAGGQNITATITIADAYYEEMDGKWKIKELITDAETFNSLNYDMFTEEELVGFPAYNQEDAFEFDFENWIFTPSFQSEFKNYFIGVSNLEPAGDCEVYLDNNYPPTTADALLISMDNINRYFSSEDVSEDKQAFVGVRLITDEETQEQLLEMFVLDYTSHSFCKSMLDYAYMPEKPVANSSGIVLRMTFQRVD